MWKEVSRFFLSNSLKWTTLGDNLRGYSGKKWRQDAVAAFNVAMLAFPQGMAYAVIAGLPIQYGITCGIVASLIGPLFASSRFTMLGPTNATAFMVFSYFANYPGLAEEKIVLLPLVVFLASGLLMVGAFLRAAELIQFISRTVVVGYISGAACLILLGQAKEILGVQIGSGGDSGRTFFTVLYETLRQVPQTNWLTLALSLATFLVYYFFRRFLKWIPAFGTTLALMTLVSAALSPLDFAKLGVSLPTFDGVSLADIAPDLSVFTNAGLLDNVGRMFGLAFAIAFLAALENSVMAKSLATRAGDRIDLNQDMLSLGAANLGTAFFSGMPASGSLTRSALNFDSRATSPLSSLMCAGLCLGALAALGRFLGFVPKCCLASLVCCIAISLIHTKNIRISLKTTGSDAATLIATFLATLMMPLHVAIFFGVGISVMLYLRKASKPHLVEYEFDAGGDLREIDDGAKRKLPFISIVHVEGDLFFGAAELFRTQVQRTAQDPNLKVIILRLKNARHLDATSVMALEELIVFMREQGRAIIVSGCMKEAYKVLKNSGVIEVLGRENIFMGSTHNPNISTRNALKRAQEILGTDDAEIKIFFDPSHSQK